ncbi:MAG: aminotransferase class I/II-fold pyridoxal phosphate-dependent enzyme [Myxococcota bacterium]
MADLARRHAATAETVENAVLAVLRSGRWIGGPVVQEAEAAIAHAFGREAAVGVASGTDALILALQASGVTAGDEVAVPALTFFATAGAVCALGAVPRIVDVDARGLMDAAALERLDGARLRAVVPVHLFGNRCTVQRIGVRTVDDAAQAIGCTPAASTGELTALSTYPTKMLSSAGDGGFVVGDRSVVERVRRLGSHGLVGPHLHERVAGHVGRNSRLDAMSAAVVLGQLPTLGDRIRRRQAIARHYDERMSPALLPLQRDPANPVPSYLVRAADRDALVAHLDRHGIDSTVYYPRPLHRQPALVGRIPPSECPVADRLCTELLAIPVHAGLTDDEVERVAKALESA